MPSLRLSTGLPRVTLSSLLLLLATGPALAQVPLPGPPPLPLPAAYPAEAVAPFPLPAGYPGADPPYTPMRRRSPGMIAAGVILVSAASVGFIAGPALIASSNQVGAAPPCPFGADCVFPQGDPTLGKVGIAMIALGVAALGAGIPVLVIGAQKVPDRDDGARLSFAPSAPIPVTLRLGLGGAALGVRF